MTTGEYSSFRSNPRIDLDRDVDQSDLDSRPESELDMIDNSRRYNDPRKPNDLTSVRIALKPLTVS